MTTVPRLGFIRIGEPKAERTDGKRKGRCARTSKIRHPSEADALRALARVRDARALQDDGRLPENRIYRCAHCEGWHLTSRELHPAELDPPKERGPAETWEEYAHRLERRIAEQRAHTVSLHTLGHGVANRATRKRIASLVEALGRMTERWENERRNRQELVRQLEQLRSQRRFFRLRRAAT